MKGTKPAMQQDKAAIEKIMAAPKWLSSEAKKEWKRVMPILTERRILTDADLGGLENYCICIGRARQMEAAIQVESDPELMLKFVRVQDKSMASARQLAAELGLTPVSRSRPAMREDQDDGPDPLDI